MKFTKYMFNFPHEATKQILLYNAFSGALALIESEKWETVKYWQLHGIDNSDPDLISELLLLLQIVIFAAHIAMKKMY